MDGNRRYAQKNNFKKIQGHDDGASKLLDVLKWSLYFGIKEITVFALSIDNFNRSSEEIKDLMELVKEKYSKLQEKADFFTKYGIKVCIFGNLNFVDKEVRELFMKLEKETENNSK